MKQIEYYYKGSYEDQLFSNSEFFMFQKQLDTLKRLKCTRKTLQPGDKVFFANHIDYPRFKFRSWGETQNISIAKTPKTANVIIVESSYLNNLDDVKKLVLSKQYLPNPTSVLAYYNRYVMIEDYFYLRFDNLDEVEPYIPTVEKMVNVEVYDVGYNYNYVKDQKALDQLSLLIEIAEKRDDLVFMDYSDFTKQVIHETVMDREFFDTIHQMLESSDQETLDLAGELITNINIQESFFYLTFLFFHYGRKLRDSMSWNKVTFAPLRKVMEDVLSIPTFNRLPHESSNYRKFIEQVIHKRFTKEQHATIDYNLLKEYYIKDIARIVSASNINEINIEHVIFTFDERLFPYQFVGYKEAFDEQKEQDSGNELGEELQDSLSEYLPENSDEQE